MVLMTLSAGWEQRCGQRSRDPYRDQSNLGTSGYIGYGVFVYDVTDLVNKSGDNTLFLEKAEKYPSVYPSVLIYMYNTTISNTIKEVYINNGGDLLLANSYNLANRSVQSNSIIKVNPKVTSDAKLYVFASNAQNKYGDLVFNGEIYENVWATGTQYCTTYKELDVTGKIKDTNTISFVSTGGTILALQQIMVLTKNLDDIEITIAPEYTNTAFAGTNNLITIKIEALKAGKFNATLLANGVEVNKTEVDLAVGTNTFKLMDNTIREVNATTVNGAANDKVNYTLQLSSGKNASIIVPILYNGYLGKDLAYPDEGIESFLNITINGDIVIDVKDVSTKLGGDDMNRTDVWNINLDGNSNIVKSYIYVPYNWCKVAEDETLFNVTFNGVQITPIAMYRDQSNLGSSASARYGYGVFVYDVTGLINKSGDNKFVLNKKTNTPSVYPSVLVYMYNTTGSAVIKNVYISNGADLLSKTTANVAGRTPVSYSTINVENILDTATLYVFASNAMSNYGNLVFNGENYTNIWSGASYATQVYTLDITNSIKNSNNISFVATGGSILALQQIIVVTKNVKVEPKNDTTPVTPVTPIIKKATKITAKKATFKAKKKVKKYSITLKAGKTPVKNVQVTIKIGKKTYKAKTNAKGKATFKIKKLTKKGTYKAKISFKGNQNYKAASKTVKIKIK